MKDKNKSEHKAIKNKDTKKVKEEKIELKADKKIEKKSDLKLKDKASNKVKEIKDKRIKKKNESEEINKIVSFNLLEVVIIILITGIVVSIASGLIVYNNYENLYKSNTTISKSDLKEFEENYNNIVNKYVGEVDKAKLLESAISGMYSYLNDEYSIYMSKEDTDTLQEQLNGEYVGIGIEVTTYYENEDMSEKQTVITRVFSDSPAEKAGLMPCDIITKVDGKDIVDSNEISNTIKNGSKNTYEITYIRDGKENKTTITRDRIIIDSVSSQTYDTVGYLKIDTFSATTKDQMIKKLDSFDKNVKSLVIDLRDNTGGSLTAAYDISDLFIEKGKVIYQLKYKNEKIEKFKAKDDVYKKFDKIVVLINSNSASASEILALALKESADAKIVGVTSFGKGTAQDTEKLSSGAMVKYTSSYWLSPNGNSINKTGITPDIVEENYDEQINKAIETAK